MAKKPVKRADRVEVIYGKESWRLLHEQRQKTMDIMMPIEKATLACITHGSIARGDVSETSDIDVFVSDPSSSFVIESALERVGITVNRRFLVQATPSYAAKGYIELDPKSAISFPLMKLRSVERDLYQFSGQATFQMLRDNSRVKGVDKRLVLIAPTAKGHIEDSIVGKEETVAKLLDISVDTVLDRVHALLRRDKVGRTGVFIKRELAPTETYEMVLKQLADENPAVRRRLRLFGY